MAGNSFGEVFKITTCGESHGGAIAVIVDGCPANLMLKESDIQHELDRRKPGQSHITTPRDEKDTIHILSGVFNNHTTGTPILLIAYNTDAKPQDYEHLKDVYRPSHADFTYQMKYGIRDYRGSARASARETLVRVASGAIAKKYLKEHLGVEIISHVESIGNIKTNIDIKDLSIDEVESDIVRCGDKETSMQMVNLIKHMQNTGNSVGGVIRCVIRGVPVGLGEPVFDKLHADLGKAMLSINAVKGFEIGSGFMGTTMDGVHHNDELYVDKNTQKVATKTNHSGGVVGGISNGEDIYFRVAFKPVSTIGTLQQTIDINNQDVTIECNGRHDACVLPRAVPIVDAMSAIVIMDHHLRHKIYQ